jgi:hypothetical protein
MLSTPLDARWCKLRNIREEKKVQMTVWLCLYYKDFSLKWNKRISKCYRMTWRNQLHLMERSTSSIRYTYSGILHPSIWYSSSQCINTFKISASIHTINQYTWYKLVNMLTVSIHGNQPAFKPVHMAEYQLLWGCATKSNIAVIQRYQTKLLGTITNAPRYVSNQTLHSDLHIPHGIPGTDSYSSHDPGLAPQPSHGTTSAPAKQQALKTKMDIWWDTLKKRRWTPPRPPPTGTAH